jgi:hypothetical protein
VKSIKDLVKKSARIQDAKLLKALRQLLDFEDRMSPKFLAALVDEIDHLELTLDTNEVDPSDLPEAEI